MSTRKINWIQEYLKHNMNGEAPDEFHLWTAISTIGAALGRKVWFDMGNHIVVPNFYIIFVSPPGVVQKSTTLGAGKEFLKQLDGIRFGPDTVTWQAITDSLQDAVETVEVPLRNGDIDYLQISAIHLAVGELGTFFQEKDADKINLMTHLWDAPKDYTKRTRMDGELIIHNPCINFISGCTPSWIADNLDHYFIGGGLSSRVIFIFADKKARRIAYPENHQNNYRRQQLIEELRAIASLKGEFKMDPDAKAIGISFYNEICDMLESDSVDPRYKSFIARMQTHYHKVCMVISAASRIDLTIDAHCATAAKALVLNAYSKLPSVYNLIGQTQEVKHHDVLLKAFDLSGKPALTEDELFNAVQKQLSHWQFKNALASIIASKDVGKKQIQSDIYYYRKRT